MLAFAIIGALLITSVISYTNTLKFTSEKKQLYNVISQLAAMSISTANLLTQENSSAQAFVDLPQTIGNQQYWLGFQNDSSASWIYGGFGGEVQKTGFEQMFLPIGLNIEGNFVSGYGSAILKGSMNGSTITLNLENIGA